MTKFNIDPTKNYEYVARGDVFTGQQILNLLDIAGESMQAVILLSIAVTDQPATEPNSRYGVASAGFGKPKP